MPKTLLLLCLLPLTAAAWAAEPIAAAGDEPQFAIDGAVPVDAATIAARAAERARASRLREAATTMRHAAEARHQEAQQACYRKFLVNDCLDDAKRALKAAQIEARKVDGEAREIERSLHRIEVAERDAKRREEAPRRAQEKEEQAAQAKEEQEETRLKVERRRAEKEQKIGGGLPR